MPKHKSHLRRLMHISALLKENSYPNSETLARDFRRIEAEEGIDIDCTKKTILRDMKSLEVDYGCPLRFDRGRNGYCLRNPNWDFMSPALLDENEMLAAVMGGHVAGAILPPPLKGKVCKAVEFLLEKYTPHFLDSANMNTLTILSGLYAAIDPGIFMTMYNGWQGCRCVRIVYTDYQGETTERVFEPHTLVFYNDSWYSKGHCQVRNETRTFALHRIQSATLEAELFRPKRKITASVTPDDFLDFDKIEGVQLRITPPLRDRLASHPLHSRQKINPDHTVDIPALSREVLFPFLLAQQGEAVLLKPASLRAEFKKVLQRMQDPY